MNKTTPAVSMRILLRVLSATVILLVTLNVDIYGAHPSEALNRNADAAKARSMVEAAEVCVMENAFVTRQLIDRAMMLNGNDTLVMASANNFELMRNPQGNPIYYAQQNLLDRMPTAPMMYYYILTNSTPPRGETTDSLTIFKTALKAYNRFPDSEMFIESLMGSGVNYIFNRKFVTLNNEVTDTLDLAPSDIAFADSLLILADSIEKRTGFSPTIDRSRGAIYTMLERKDDLNRLVSTLEQRDSTDIETLDLLTTIAIANNDTVRVSELGMRRFELNPDGQHVFSLYGAITEDSLRNRLINAVLRKASDTDLEPGLRLDLLRALTTAYYSDLADSVNTAPVLDRISDTLTEIAAEDPSDEDVYFQGTILARDIRWPRNYGYRQWQKAVEMIADSTGSLNWLASVLVSTVEKNTDLEKHLSRLADTYVVTRPDLVLSTRLLLAQHLFNNEKYAKVLEIVEPLSISDFQENYRLHNEYLANHPDEGSDKDDDTSEDSYLKKWIVLQTLVSEAQMKLERVDDALATLNHIIALDPENAGALNNLAYYMCENGRDLTIALSLVNRSLAINSENLNAIDTRAWILYKKGDIKAALKDMSDFFNILSVNMDNELLRPDNPLSAEEVLLPTANVEAVAPIMGHLLAILSEDSDADPISLWRIADVVMKYDPDNDELAQFLSTHKRPESISIPEAETATETE